MKIIYSTLIALLLSYASYGSGFLGGISGTTSVCIGGTSTLSDTTAGGVWSSSDNTIASVDSITGVVTGNAEGTTIISYSASGAVATITFTVNPNPSAIVLPAAACAGDSVTFTDSSLGGSWSISVNGIAPMSFSGSYAGLSGDVLIAFYTLPTGCLTVSTPITINPAPDAIMASTTTICAGGESTLSDATSGGVWSVSPTASALVVIDASGVCIGTALGTATVTYTLPTGCTATLDVTIVSAPDPITGSPTACVGVGVPLTDATTGGTWSCSPAPVVVISPTGFYTGTSAGTGTVSYTLSAGCLATLDVTILPAPVVAITTIPSCSNLVELMASGAMTYSWSPTTGLSCAVCTNPYADPAVSATYSLTGTNSYGCVSTTSITLNDNRINGHISFSGPAPDTTDCKVWLIQFNPADSTIYALDSTTTCSDAGAPYFEFDGKPLGSYMVKAKLLSGAAPGASGYIPTYSAASPYWNMAATAAHTSTTDVLDINMQYGTVPTGPGFIAGSVVSGAGKHTSTDVPAANMLVYLEDASATILTYTYTDASGLYSFSGLAYGTYHIYPVDYDYYTTPSSSITLTSGSDSMMSVNFKQHTTFGTITPYTGPTMVPGTTTTDHFSIYPNPAASDINLQWNNLELGTASVSFTDMLGRSAYTLVMDIRTPAGNKILNISILANGVYFVTVRSGSSVYTQQLVISK